MENPAFIDRWSDLVLDQLFVPRTGVQSLSGCYGDGLLGANDEDTALAEFVLDNSAVDDVFVNDAGFNFRDLLRQSLVLDDLSPVYRAHLYALLTRLNGCGNVDPIGQELAFRDEVGHVFEAAYLNRDPVCLTCHNTANSVTDDDDEAKDRHWPLRGRFEDSVFGASSVDDPRVSRAVFRVSDFVGGGGGAGEELFGDIGYCFVQASTSVNVAPCVDGVANCGDDFPFCLSPIESPECAADGVTATCPNLPFCTDNNFTTFDVSACDGGAPSCANPTDFAVCGDFFSAPSCDENGQVFCDDGKPDDAGEGEGEGEGEGDVVAEGEGEAEAAAGTFSPWGADPVCGTFTTTIQTDDPASIDGRFASLRGQRITVVQLEQSLKRGVDALAVRGLVVDDDNQIRNPDDAFAYLVAANIVDNVWREVTGTGLTISTHFPRNRAQRDLLQSLTDHFVQTHFSLRELLADVVTSGYVNITAPEDACAVDGSDDDGADEDDVAAFAFPPVFDPWVRDEPVVEQRNNSTADAVHALSARTLLSAAYAALGWPAPLSEAFPDGDINEDLDFTCFDQFPDCATLEQACAEGSCCDERDAACGVVDGPLSEDEIQQGIGVFHGISEKGFRGLDFQARLFFEARFGRCQKPDDVVAAGLDDAVDAIAARARAQGTARDAVLALKERITRDTSFDQDERALLEGVFGGSLDVAAEDVADLDGKLRTVCGALLASPQFQLTGIASPSSPPARLQPSTSELCAAPLPGCR